MKFKLHQHYSLYGFSNSYLLGNDETKEAIIVDPGEFTVKLLNHIERNGYYVSTVLLSHAHIHHVRGITTLLKIYEAELYAATPSILGRACTVVRDQEIFRAGGFEVEAFSLPGHSPDSMAYRIGHLFFTGDALHAGFIGKTLSPFNARLLAERLRARLLEQDDDTIILPGHGPPSTVGSEKLCNLGLKADWADKVRSDYDFFV